MPKHIRSWSFLWGASEEHIERTAELFTRCGTLTSCMASPVTVMHVNSWAPPDFLNQNVGYGGDQGIVLLQTLQGILMHVRI